MKKEACTEFLDHNREEQVTPVEKNKTLTEIQFWSHHLVPHEDLSHSKSKKEKQIHRAVVNHL